MTSLEVFNKCVAQRSFRACVYDSHVANSAKVRGHVSVVFVVVVVVVVVDDDDDDDDDD
jgi:hypothetical protein